MSGEFGRNPLILDAIRLAQGRLSTEYVGAKPSRRIMCRRYFGLFQKPDCIGNQPKGQPAVSPFLALKRNARNKFLPILAAAAMGA